MNTADATRLALQRATILDEIADSSSCVKAADVAHMAAAMLRELARTVQAAEDPRPCRGVNTNICVAEGCYGEACIRTTEVTSHVG